MTLAAKNGNSSKHKDFVTEHWKQHGREIQKYGDVVKDLPHPLDAEARTQICKKLNHLLADSIVLRDLYKKHHWQVAGPTFYQLHLLFDKHFNEQVDIVDTIAERIQLLGGVTIAMGADAAEVSNIPAPPRGREEVPVQISRLLHAHSIIIADCLDLSKAADDVNDQGTNDLVVSDVLRPNELQSWFIGQHLVDMPLIHTQ